MFELYRKLAAEILIALSLAAPTQNSISVPLGPGKPVASAPADDSKKIIHAQYAGETEVPKVKHPEQIRIDRRKKLEDLVRNLGGSEGIERATGSEKEAGYKLMSPLDSFGESLLARLYNRNKCPRGDLFLFCKTESGVNFARLTETPGVMESACFVSDKKGEGLICLVEDRSGPVSDPDLPPKVYCFGFGINGKKPEIKYKREIVLPEDTMAVYDIAYNPLEKRVVLDMEYLGVRGIYALDSGGKELKLYRLENKPEKTPEGKK